MAVALAVADAAARVVADVAARVAAVVRVAQVPEAAAVQVAVAMKR